MEVLDVDDLDEEELLRRAQEMSLQEAPKNETGGIRFIRDVIFYSE